MVRQSRVDLCLHARGDINLWMLFREQDWPRGSAGSGRVSETEHAPHQLESLPYVRIEWTYVCMRVVILICGCFVFRQQHWLRGSAGSGRVSETEHDSHRPESPMYVRIEWTYVCMRVVILIC